MRGPTMVEHPKRTPDNPKPKKTPPLKIPLTFDEAVERLAQYQPDQKKGQGDGK